MGLGSGVGAAACAPRVAASSLATQGCGIPAPGRGPPWRPGPAGSRPTPDCRPGAETARARTARRRWAEGRPGLRSARCRQNFPASWLPHPDHESATVGKINFNFGSAALVAPKALRRGCWVCSCVNAGGRTQGPGTPTGRPWGSEPPSLLSLSPGGAGRLALWSHPWAPFLGRNSGSNHNPRREVAPAG